MPVKGYPSVHLFFAITRNEPFVLAAVAAGEELRVGKANVKADLADTALAGIAAAETAGGAAREQVDALMDKGRDLVDSAADLIRERPIAAFGTAFAAGWIIAKLARSK